MAGRFPFDASGHSGGNPLSNPQVRAALGLSNIDEAVYLQRQQELQRDFQIRQILLQEQFDQQNRLENIQNMIVQEQQLKALGEQLQEYPDLQQHYSRLLLNEQLQRNEERNHANDRLRLQGLAEEELRRRQLLARQQQIHQQNPQLSPQIQPTAPPPPSIQCVNQSILRDMAADSLAGNAVKRSDVDKRHFAQPKEKSSQKKRSRSNSKDSAASSDGSKKANKGKKSKKNGVEAVSDGAEKKTDDKVNDESNRKSNQEHKKSSVQDLLDLAASDKTVSGSVSAPNEPPTATEDRPKSSRASFGDLIEAARAETRNDDAAGILASIKKDTTEWSDSEDEAAAEEEQRQIAMAKGDTIILPNFESFLPQLPEEPVLVPPPGKTKKKKKRRGILDDDDSSVEAKSSGKKKDGKSSKAMKDEEKKAFERAFGDLLYPIIDTWWPTVTSIKRERKALGQSNLDEDENLMKVGNENQFRANMDEINYRLKHEVEPGLLEKIPHCRCHRMAMKKRKNPTAPELVYCTQVTELYPNEMMVCCSRCGTWRHTACGGHYKQYSVREAIEKPFEPICDRCYVEEKILADKPHAKKRIDRQRCQQLRRGLSTSAAMRQHSFSKHGGTYKWPLGSVSATHIGGHTRSVHSRHDKAEKQWTDMATKLGRGYGHRPKEKVKVRTKELERLLISIEDAEGHTDRHNMLVFLMQDTLKEHPTGFEKQNRNIFDPADDESDADLGSDSEEQPESKRNPLDSSEGKCKGTNVSNDPVKSNEKLGNPVCVRQGCSKKARFDSVFCSDACGVSVLESDLLRTLFYASDIHPSSLRH